MKINELNVKISRIFTIVLMLTASLFVFTACEKEDDGGEDQPATDNIWEIVESREDLSALKDALEGAGLDAQLSATGDKTLFAPSNEAMTNLLTTLGLTSFDPVAQDVTMAVLAYHVSASKILSDALPASIPTLQGENISVQGTDLVSGATSPSKVTEADILATNGVVHIIDVVMVPPTVGAQIVALLGTVAQPLFLASDFTILRGAIMKADTFATTAGATKLLDILKNGDATLTVFAPANAALQQGGITAGSFTGQQWYGIILNHILPTVIVAEDLVATSAGTVIPTYYTAAVDQEYSGITYLGVVPSPLGANAPGLKSNYTTENPDAWVAVPDADIRGNGVVHAIAGVLAPAKPICGGDDAASLVGEFDVVNRDASPAACGDPANDDDLRYRCTITLVETLENGDIIYSLSDVTGGLYVNCYTDGGENPGNIRVSGYNVYLENQPDTVYGDDEFNGEGSIDCDGNFTLSWSNGFGDQGTSMYTIPEGARLGSSTGSEFVGQRPIKK